jgi:CheY-like chemotaxis protein
VEPQPLDAMSYFDPTPAPEADRSLPAAVVADGRVNILIVDDEPANLKVLEAILDDPGYRLVRALNANDALLALVAEDFGLLILDIRMPDMSGFELAQLIKQRKKSASVPIIFLTAFYNEDQDVVAGYGTGAVDYLHKPVNATVLRSKVAVFVELHRKSRELVMAEPGAAARGDRAAASRRAAAGAERVARSPRDRALGGPARERAAVPDHGRPDAGDDVGGQSRRRRGLRQQGVLLLSSASRTRRRLHTGWRMPLHDDDRRLPAGAVRGAAHPRPFQADARMRRSDGEWRWMTSHGAPRTSPSGEFLGMIVTSQDITDQRQAASIQQQIARAKDEFIAVLAHELRSPLAPIRTSVGIIRAHATHPLVIRCGEIIDRQTAHMARLLDDLLDTSRLSRNTLTLQRARVRLGDVLQSAMEIASPLIEQQRLDLVVDGVDEPVWLDADHARLTQVFGNLLNNAANYSKPSGRVD